MVTTTSTREKSLVHGQRGSASIRGGYREPRFVVAVEQPLARGSLCRDNGFSDWRESSPRGGSEPLNQREFNAVLERRTATHFEQGGRPGFELEVADAGFAAVRARCGR